MALRRELMSYLGTGAIGGIIGYYARAQGLLGIKSTEGTGTLPQNEDQPTESQDQQSQDSDSPEDSTGEIEDIQEELYAQHGLAFNSGSIYYESDNELHEYSTAQNEVVNSFSYPSDGRDWPRGLAYGDESLWFSDASGPAYSGAVAELDPSSGEELGRITMSWDPVGLGFGDGSLWVLDITGNTIREYSPDGEQLSSFDYSGPAGTTFGRGLTYHNGSIWMGNFCESDGCTVSLFEFDTDGQLIQEVAQRTGSPPTGYGGLTTTETQLLGPDKNGNVTVLREL